MELLPVILVLGQLPNHIRRQDFSSLFLDILAPPSEIRHELETDAIEQTELASWKSRPRN